MNAAGKSALDPLTAASVTVAWTIAGNKPFYPLYVWWLIDRSAATATLWTLASLPIFAALPFLARRTQGGARLGLVLAGIADTIFASLVLGRQSGAIYFLFPCLMLAALGLRRAEMWMSRAAIALSFFFFVALMRFGGSGLHAWTEADARILADLNLYCAITLSAFIALRFSAVSRGPALDA